jgi:hypothetical protein
VRSNVIRAGAHEFYEGLGFNRFKSQAIFSKSVGSACRSDSHG